MQAEVVRQNAFAMPFANPACPKELPVFCNREFLVIP
jgi:acetoacetate decarboxylase